MNVSMALSQGSSGSAVFNMCGHIVGIVAQAQGDDPWLAPEKKSQFVPYFGGPNSSLLADFLESKNQQHTVAQKPCLRFGHHTLNAITDMVATIRFNNHDAISGLFLDGKAVFLKPTNVAASAEIVALGRHEFFYRKKEYKSETFTHSWKRYGRPTNVPKAINNVVSLDLSGASRDPEFDILVGQGESKNTKLGSEYFFDFNLTRQKISFDTSDTLTVGDPVFLGVSMPKGRPEHRTIQDKYAHHDNPTWDQETLIVRATVSDKNSRFTELKGVFRPTYYSAPVFNGCGAIVGFVNSLANGRAKILPSSEIVKSLRKSGHNVRVSKCSG